MKKFDKNSKEFILKNGCYTYNGDIPLESEDVIMDFDKSVKINGSLIVASLDANCEVSAKDYICAFKDSLKAASLIAAFEIKAIENITVTNELVTKELNADKIIADYVSCKNIMCTNISADVILVKNEIIASTVEAKTQLVCCNIVAKSILAANFKLFQKAVN